jgi:transcriptional regulator with XRE-family HTH domain
MREENTVGNDAFSIGRTPDATRRFGLELKRSRRAAGLTQRELADRVRYSREMVAAVERGRRYGSRELAVRCDEVLGTGGILGRLWPMVEREQFAADRRRGPRPDRPPRIGRSEQVSGPKQATRDRTDRAPRPTAVSEPECQPRAASMQRPVPVQRAMPVPAQRAMPVPVRRAMPVPTRRAMPVPVQRTAPRPVPVQRPVPLPRSA